MRIVPPAVSLTQNIAAMYVLQGASYIIPFFTLPFLVRMLGSESFGLLAISQAVVMILVMFVDSGFNQAASRNIAIHRNDPRQVSEIYWSTQVIRLLLGIVGAVVLAGIVASVPAWRAHWPIFLVQGLLLIGTLAMPVWYFSGMERMRQTAIYNIGARLLSAAAIFTLVRSPEDVVLAAACQAAATLVGGLAMHWRVLRHEVPWRRPGIPALRSTFARGRTFFASEFIAGAASNSNVLLLGIFASTGAAGIYAAIDKMMRALESLIHPILTAFSPRVTRAFESADADAAHTARKLSIGVAVMVLAMGLFTFINATWILDLLFGEHLTDYDDALRGMSAWIVLRGINLGLFEFYYIAPGRFARLSRLLLLGVCVQLSLGILLTSLWQLHGMVAAAVLTEALIFLMSCHVFRRRATPLESRT